MSDGPGAAEAAAWLTMLGHEFTEVLIMPIRSKRSMHAVENDVFSTSHPTLTAYPNPSNGPLYLSYQVPEGVEHAEMRLYDAQGALQFVRQVAPQNGILEVLPKNLAAGLHVASLYLDGILVSTAKVNLLR